MYTISDKLKPLIPSITFFFIVFKAISRNTIGVANFKLQNVKE